MIYLRCVYIYVYTYIEREEGACYGTCPFGVEAFRVHGLGLGFPGFRAVRG